MSAVEPFLYVPIAVNCWTSPTIKLGGEIGVTAMEDNISEFELVTAFVDEQAATLRAKEVTNPKIRKETIEQTSFLFKAIHLYSFCKICPSISISSGHFNIYFTYETVTSNLI